MRGAAFVDHSALHALVDRADEQRQRAAAGMSRAGDALRVHLGARQQIIDSAHAVPDAVMRQVFAHEQQDLTGHGMLVGGVRNVGVSGLRIPVLAALALADGVVGQHHKSAVDHVEVSELILGIHARQGVMAAR